MRIQPAKAIRLRPFPGGEARTLSGKDLRAPEGVLGMEVIERARNKYGEIERRWALFPLLDPFATMYGRPYGILLYAPAYLALKDPHKVLKKGEEPELVQRHEQVDNLSDLYGEEVIELEVNAQGQWEEYFR